MDNWPRIIFWGLLTLLLSPGLLQSQEKSDLSFVVSFNRSPNYIDFPPKFEGMGPTGDGIGLTFGYYLKPDFIFESSIKKLELSNYFLYQGKYFDYEVTGYSLGAGIRSFPKTYFNYKLGLTYYALNTSINGLNYPKNSFTRQIFSFTHGTFFAIYLGVGLQINLIYSLSLYVDATLNKMIETDFYEFEGGLKYSF